MSKVDAQRAMREAKYARLRASGPTRREAAAASGAASSASVPSRAESTPTVVTPPSRGASEDASPADDRCGHTSMNGRSCTRERSHSEKNHRYG